MEYTDMNAALTACVGIVWGIGFTAALGALIYGFFSNKMRNTMLAAHKILDRDASTRYQREQGAPLDIATEAPDGCPSTSYVLPALSQNEISWILSARTREHYLYRRRERSTKQ